MLDSDCLTQKVVKNMTVIVIVDAPTENETLYMTGNPGYFNIRLQLLHCSWSKDLQIVSLLRDKITNTMPT